MPQPLASLDRVQLREQGKSLSLTILPGELIAVMGPTNSGKSDLLDFVSGERQPKSGTVDCNVPRVLCGDPAFPRRATPMSLAKAAADSPETQRMAVALTALGLAELRDTQVSRLTPSQMIATALIGALVPERGLVCIDGLLDLLDPWRRESVWRAIDDDLDLGKSFVIATNSPALAERCDQIVVVGGGNMVFAGTVAQLLADAGPTTFTVECDDQSAVAAMVEPFAINIKKSPGQVIFTSHCNQALAAHLLTYGYGAVKSVIATEPTVADALRSLRVY